MTDIAYETILFVLATLAALSIFTLGAWAAGWFKD